MNKEENIKKIKESLKRLFSATEVVEVKLEEVVLVDGTKVTVDKLEKDGIAKLEDGSFAPVGEHTLEDGKTIVVGENGVIVEIKEAKTEDETPVEEAKVENEEIESPETETESPETEDVVAKLESRIAKLEEAIAMLTGSNEELKKSVAEFAAQPADEPAIVERKFARVDKSDKVTEILKLRARIKKSND
jgi:hypothetical protein